MQFISVPDLCQRWLYTPQGVRKLVRSATFPPSLFTVSCGRVPVWELSQIVAWEDEHPEVYDPGLKVRKQRGYFRAKMKGPQPTISAGELQP